MMSQLEICHLRLRSPHQECVTKTGIFSYIMLIQPVDGSDRARKKRLLCQNKTATFFILIKRNFLHKKADKGNPPDFLTQNESNVSSPHAH